VLLPPPGCEMAPADSKADLYGVASLIGEMLIAGLRPSLIYGLLMLALKIAYQLEALPQLE
jgi:hypothetical protein